MPLVYRIEGRLKTIKKGLPDKIIETIEEYSPDGKNIYGYIQHLDEFENLSQHDMQVLMEHCMQIDTDYSELAWNKKIKDGLSGFGAIAIVFFIASIWYA